MSPTTALLWFGLTTLMLVGIEIMFTYATLGFKYGFSANRVPTEKSAFAKRISNAYTNHVESAAYGVPILAAAAFLNLQGGGVETAALLFVVARIAFAALYFTGITFVRVPAFLVGSLSAFYLAYQIIINM